MFELLKGTLISLLYLFGYLNRIFLRNNILYVCHHSFPGNIGPLQKVQKGKIYFTKKAFILDGSLTNLDYNILNSPVSYLFFILDLLFSKTIVVDDSLVAMGKLNFSSNQKIIQVWHACGAFKKFGYTSLHNQNKKILNPMYKKYSCVSVSSESVREYYAESFGVSIKKIVALGVPRTDLYFDSNYIEKVRSNFFSENSFLEGKKIILYAPTFREQSFFKQDNLDALSKLYEELKDKYNFIYTLHPYDSNKTINGVPKKLNFTGHYDFSIMAHIADVLITDYSSVIFEYSLLDKPMLFFTPDLEEYESTQRGLFFKFENFVPGFFSRDINEIISKVQIEDYELGRIDQFKNKFMSACDGNATQRIIDFING